MANDGVSSALVVEEDMVRAAMDASVERALKRNGVMILARDMRDGGRGRGR